MKPVYSEVITIGDEILYGQITDTNSQWIGAELDKIGVQLIRKTSIGDIAEEIVNALKEAESRADIIIITGGLGPTKDDLTKITLAKYFDSEMYENQDALALIKSYFEKRGRTTNALNLSQAMLPVKSRYLENRLGTAPGMWFDKEGKVIVSIAGVPYEMQALMTNHVIPGILGQFKLPCIHHRFIKTVGVGESIIAEKISEWEDQLPDHIRLAYLPSVMQVHLRLTARGENLDVLKEQVGAEINKVLPMINKYVFGFDNDELDEALGDRLKKLKKTIAAAESCTGGSIASTLSAKPGSSDFFVGGVVAYSNDVKINMLNVQPETLKNFGAVSGETVREMAENVRKLLGADIGLACSGIAGPGGGTEDKPVGTIWLAVSSETGTVAKLLNLGSTRENNIKATVVLGLELVRQSLQNEVVKNA